MTRIVSIVLFALGAVVVLWMGAGFIGSSLLALLVSVLIAAAYTTGFVELLRYQSETDALSRAMETSEQPIEDLQQWLKGLPLSLRFAVRQRINGEALGLPAPLLTPYLVGLLVMLGLLGTFIGMVETLQGAVGALEGNTELEAVRDGLAAPIQGLGLAFATSVAGITASAMLGLISTLSRRERLQVSRLLDSEMAGAFKQHSLNFQRRETYDVLRAQASALPAAAEQLGLLAKHFDERMQQLTEQLSENQDNLQNQLIQQVEKLSQSVEASLTTGFQDTGRVAAESAAPVLKDFVAELDGQSKATQRELGATVGQQLSDIKEQLSASNSQLEQSWSQVLKDQESANQSLLKHLQETFDGVGVRVSESSESLLSQIQKSQSAWLETVGDNEQKRLEQLSKHADDNAQQLSEASAALARESETMAKSSQHQLAALMDQSELLLKQQMQREAAWQTEAETQLAALVNSAGEQLSQLREEEQQRGEAAIVRLEQLQESSAQQLAELGTALEAPMTRLMETASDAPKAAAEVIAQLREEISKNIERDNDLLKEREQTLSQMATLSASLEENARLQREAVESMLQGSSDSMASVAEQFEQKVSAESTALSEQIANFTANTAELSVLGEVFNKAVQQFGDSNAELMSQLAKIETSLVGAGERSDEQMAYYLSQAREIIDHNLLTQQEILDRLQAVGGAAES